MRKPDTRTHSSSRDIRTPVADKSVTPDRVMVDPQEDSSSSDGSLSSDIPTKLPPAPKLPTEERRKIDELARNDRFHR